MKLSVNVNNLMSRYDFQTCANIYAKAGFDAVDYGLFGMVSDNDPFNGENYREIAEGEKKIADAAGIEINQTHAPFSFSGKLFADENAYRDIIYPRFIRSIEISAILGAKVCVMHPLHHFVYHGHEEEIFEKNMEFYRSLIPYCKEYGIAIGVENMWQVDGLRKCIVHDTCSRKEEFVRYIDTLDSEYMVACLDVGHVGLPLQDDEAQDVILALGHDRLKALHVHDNDYKGDQHVLPFQGKMNWQAITAALKQIDYTGDFTYEVNTLFMRGADDTFVPVGAKYMADVGKHLISMIENA